MKNKILIALLVLSAGLGAFAQDIQYSQFYANALYLNPAFAGSNQNTRAIAHARLQWPSLDATYTGSTFSLDHFFPRYRSGVGLLFNTDYLSSATGRTFRNLNIGLQYAYQLELSEEWTFRPGLQLSFAQMSFNSSGLTWGKQFNDAGLNAALPTGEEATISNAPIYYPDISAGGLLYSKKIWVGIAAGHLNQPSQSFLQDGTSKLAIKSSLHAGIKIPLGAPKRQRYGVQASEKETSISPTMLYKMQGKYDQLDLGVYVRHDYLVFGSWYRGIPVKLYNREKSNNDALVFLVGAVYKGFNVGYSYDITISKLASPYSGGAHELSLTYNFLVELDRGGKRKPSGRNRKPVCPQF